MLTIGLERISQFPELFKGKRLGLIMNQASLDCNYRSALEIFSRHGSNVTAVFGPQHGLFGHTQDNMIEWRGDEYEGLSVKVYSLYGENRKPTDNMLKDIDLLIFDVQDVGARYYTFIWTMALSMEAAAENDIEFLVLDRPNPLNGVDIEGMLPDPRYSSFVGLYPLPVRHGLTVGEIARYLQSEFIPEVRLKIIPMSGWERKRYFDETEREWFMSSPNMPSVKTALVYPGQCLLEATNISEGRGTTRPFEIFGAPWIDHEKMCDYLNNNCTGAYFQPWYFEPAFNKYSGELCKGAFIHVTDRKKFRPLAVTMTILSYLVHVHGDNFRWKEPPYEYEYKKLPIDILLGSDRWRLELEKGIRMPEEWEQMWFEHDTKWRDFREPFLMY